DSVPTRQHVGQCFVPLEQRFNKRPCTWSIVKDSREIGFITCRFCLGTTPAPVRSLHVVNASRADELRLAWEPPSSDGDLPLRGYRIEAREPSTRISAAGFPGEGFLDEPRTASAPALQDPSVTLKNLSGNTVYTIRVWAVNEAGSGPAAEVLGQTGPVAPGLCGEARISVEGEPTEPTALSIEWEPPIESGGADLVAYRIWLRPVFQDGLGGFFPADGFIDLGLFEHRGSRTQKAPVKLDQLPSCSGAVCSVAAINAAGLTGCASEAPVVWASNMDRQKEIFEL
ncbi:TTN, partial [Symbiodinium pilosum]